MFAHTTFVPGAHRGQEGLEFLELELQMVVSWLLRTKPRSRASALDHRAISLPPSFYMIKAKIFIITNVLTSY